MSLHLQSDYGENRPYQLTLFSFFPQLPKTRELSFFQKAEAVFGTVLWKYIVNICVFSSDLTSLLLRL